MFVHNIGPAELRNTHLSLGPVLYMVCHCTVMLHHSLCILQFKYGVQCE